MTLDQWQDIASKMTPEQRDAMAYFGEARYRHAWNADYTTGLQSFLEEATKTKVSHAPLNECRGIA